MRISGDARASAVAVRELRRLMPLRGLPGWVGAVFAVGSVLVAAVCRQLLAEPLRGHPFLLFFPPIILTSLLFDHGAGFLAAILSILVSAWFVPPDGTFRVAANQVFPLILFAVVSFACAAAIELLQLAICETADREKRLKAAEESGEQKETLLVESSHRVRNDLGALANLLTLQSRRVPEAAAALEAAANQVRVLGRVHSRFSQADGHAVVCSDDFLKELARDLQQIQSANADFELKVDAERAELPLDTATTLGLIVNELVTNSAKYAFPHHGHGVIEVWFRKVGEDYLLCVADNGVGPGETVRGTGMGTDLLQRLAKQLHGRFERGPREHQSGTVCTLVFPVKPATPEVKPVTPEAGRAPPPSAAEAGPRPSLQ
jgi:two-component sensor histidine kinase